MANKRNAVIAGILALEGKYISQGPVASHPIDVKKDTRVCQRFYYAFQPVKK